MIELDTVVIQIPLIAPESVRRATLRNGMTVLLRRDASAPVVAIVTYVKAGYFDETDDVVGIAHVLEHMFFKGTPARGVGEISRATKLAGGYLNAGTIYDHTSYYTVLPSSGFVRGLEIQSDAYANSLIDADELTRELEVIIQEAKRKADNAGAVATETLYETLHDRHRMRRWRIGREPGLRALGRADVLRFYRNFYQPHNTILSIVGDIDLDDAMAHVERLYGALPDAEIERDPGPDEGDHRGFRYRELAGDVTQTQLALGWRTPGTLHPDTPLLDLAASTLGTGRASRLFRAVRERRLATSVSAYNYTPTDVGVFVIHSEGPPAQALDAARAIWSELRDVRESGVGQDELWRARRLFESRWIRRLESMDGQANYLAEWESLGDWTLGDRYLERLLIAEPAQVHDAVRRYLTPERAALVAYRPAETPPVAADGAAIFHALQETRAAPLPVPPPRVASAPAVHVGRPAPERVDGFVRVYRTACGVPILVRRKAGAPLVDIGWVAPGGSTEEAERFAGLTNLLTRTAIKGTERRTATQIAEDAELLGGSISPSLGPESFGWTISVPSAHGNAAMELLADVIERPTFPDEAVATERTLATAALAQLRDDMFRYPMRLLTQAAYAGHPYGVPASGTEESLARVQADDVRAWHATRVLRSPGVIAIVGDGDPDELARMAMLHFGELQVADVVPVPRVTWPSRPIEVVEPRDKAQTALALAFPGPTRRDDARHAGQLIAGVASGLGGRFFEELRDRQSLAYTVHAFASDRREAGMFAAYIATSPEKEAVARAGLLAEFAKLREREVSEGELVQAREYAIGTRAIRQQSGGAVLGDVIDAWLFGRGLHELDEHDAHVRAVTPAAMLAFAREYFDEGRLVQGVVRGTGRSV